MPKKTAIYARVSTADQKTGLEAQVRALKEYCEQNKITDYELFTGREHQRRDGFTSVARPHDGRRQGQGAFNRRRVFVQPLRPLDDPSSFRLGGNENL